MKVVVDTNVVASGLLNPNGTPAIVLNLLVNSSIIMRYDNRIMQEYIDVLHREKFGFNASSVDSLIGYFISEGEFVAADPAIVEIIDPDDRMFYEVMISGTADFLITGNLAHYPKDSKIKSPADFLKLYRKS